MSRQDEVNQRCYTADRVATTYLRSNLQIPEVLLYFKYADEIRGAGVLDIGCGAGRTAVFLSRWAGDYRAIDYAERMVELCRERVPGVDCSVGDVRDMSRFTDGLFDVVFFSNNGLDSLVHDDRLRAFEEMHRVLRPGGLLIFSTHNRDFPGAERKPRFRISCDICATARSLVRYRRCTRNRRINRQYERTEEIYRIINDPAHNWGLLTYYITVQHQLAQLVNCGFEFLEVYDLAGERLDVTVTNTTSPWLWYAARKR